MNKWGHVKRVLVFATILARKLKLSDKELKIIQIAALLHDIGYKKQFERKAKFKLKRKDRHEKHSADMADRIMNESGFDNEEVKLVKEIILTHGDFKKCKTKLQKILFDADKLDKTTVGEVIRKSIIMHEKFKMNDEEIFLRLIKRMNEIEFHFKESRKIAEENKKKVFSAFNSYKNLLEHADKIEKKLDI